MIWFINFTFFSVTIHLYFTFDVDLNVMKVESGEKMGHVWMKLAFENVEDKQKGTKYLSLQNFFARHKLSLN